MSTQTLYAALDPASTSPASPYIRESRETLLAYEIEELAVLRFSIILTARWEGSENEGPQRRKQLRGELALLRKHYGDKIDDIAMTFGIEHAMTAKEEVERSVIVPPEIKVSGMPSYCQEEEPEGTDIDFEA